jgi:hypothetical protein
MADRIRRTFQELAQEALDVQNASNLKGVLLGWHRASCDLGEALGHAKWWQHHPIMLLWLDKIADLMGVKMQLSDRRRTERGLWWVREWAAEPTTPQQDIEQLFAILDTIQEGS